MARKKKTVEIKNGPIKIGDVEYQFKDNIVEVDHEIRFDMDGNPVFYPNEGEPLSIEEKKDLDQWDANGGAPLNLTDDEREQLTEAFKIWPDVVDTPEDRVYAPTHDFKSVVTRMGCYIYDSNRKDAPRIHIL